MVASVNKTPGRWYRHWYQFSILQLIFEIKQNVCETESNWRFWKKTLNMSTKQEILSDAAFKAWPFSSDFNFARKDGRVTTVTSKYYCPLVVNPTITCCCKELRFKCGKVPKCRHGQKLVQLRVKTSLFSYYLQILTPLLKVIVFFSVIFTVWWRILDQPFRRLLPLPCLWIHFSFLFFFNFH